MSVDCLAGAIRPRRSVSRLATACSLVRDEAGVDGQHDHSGRLRHDPDCRGDVAQPEDVAQQRRKRGIDRVSRLVEGLAASDAVSVAFTANRAASNPWGCK
jgi:hypothetical protein